MDALADALRAFGGGVVLVSHDVDTISKVCNSLWICDHGTIENFAGSIHDYKKRITAQADAAGVAKKQE